MRAVGVEPTRAVAQRFLRPPRLPFRHARGGAQHGRDARLERGWRVPLAHACIGSILPRSSSRRAARRLGRGWRGAPWVRGRVHHERRGMKIWWKRLLPLMLIAVVALVAACGDDDEGDATSAAESAAADVSSAVESASSEAESAGESVASEAESAASEATGESGVVRGCTDRRQLQGRQRPAAAGCFWRPVQDARAGHAALPGAAGRPAGNYAIEFERYDDSTAAKGEVGRRDVPKNAQRHVADADRSPSMGTFNSGCAKSRSRSSTRTRRPDAHGVARQHQPPA